ncbi:protein of unknown function [Shinella sp. WSC3-e]|nr:hypothetical protein SHINE37_40892 [Rhizobiaceae bacterium]CAK7255562.1 protein of unknown function [Shinella sp. WSC3-e]
MPPAKSGILTEFRRGSLLPLENKN